MENIYKILVINPGSTSTKVAIYENEKELNAKTLEHSAEELAKFPAQIDQLRAIVDDFNVPVLCFGLRTDFLTRLFAGSQRLMEIADAIQEIKTMCDCGTKATVNARIDSNGHIVTEGAQVVLGGNDSYIAMCHRCYVNGIREHKKIKLHGH